MSANLAPYPVIFRVGSEIHHIHGQNIGPGQSRVDGLVLGLPGLRFVQKGGGSELALAVNDLLQGTAELAGYQPVEGYFGNSLLALR